MPAHRPSVTEHRAGRDEAMASVPVPRAAVSREVSPLSPFEGRFSELPQGAAALGAGCARLLGAGPGLRWPAVPGLGERGPGLSRGFVPGIRPGDPSPFSPGKPSRAAPAPHPPRIAAPLALPFISAHLHSSSLFYF